MLCYVSLNTYVRLWSLGWSLHSGFWKIVLSCISHVPACQKPVVCHAGPPTGFCLSKTWRTRGVTVFDMPPRRRAPRVRTPAAEAPADPEVEVDIEEPHGGQQAAQEVPVPPAAAPTMKAPSSKKQKHLKSTQRSRASHTGRTSRRRCAARTRTAPCHRYSYRSHAR